MDINFFKKEKIAAMKERNKDAINAYDLIVNKILMASIDKRAKGAWKSACYDCILRV